MSNANGKKGRCLSSQFMKDLKEGFLSPLKEKVKNDYSLSLEIRDNYINIYYRGGSLLKLSAVKNKKHTYKPLFDDNYVLEKNTLLKVLPTEISSPQDLKDWLDKFPLLKSEMDNWFSKHPKPERECQQKVILDNNSLIDRSTDYFIVDIEYAKTKVGRFDMVAIQWNSDASTKKLHAGYRPKLCFIEMKYGDSALRGKCGMLKHAEQWSAYLLQDENIKYIKEEMLRLFQQKRELGLIYGLKDHPNVLEILSDEIDCIFFLTNLDPRSRKIMKIIDELKESKDLKKCKDSGVEIKLCVTNLMDYGLYKDEVVDIDEFKKRYNRQICSSG